MISEFSKPASMDRSEQRASPRRNVALDFTKGILVLFMVVYHSLNYLRTDRGGEWLLYLRFLPPSFIFIAGFLITHIYLAKYREDDPRLHRRLLVRGFKLLAVFMVLNFAASLMVKQNFNGMNLGVISFVEDLPRILLLGERRKAVFLVLVPIAYLLIFSGLLLLSRKIWRWSIHLIFCSLVFASFLLERQGIVIPNLDLFTFGLLGLIVGLYPITHIDRIAKYWFVWAILCSVYFGLLAWIGDDSYLEFVGVGLVVMFIYSTGLLFRNDGIGRRVIVVLGSYSLWAYILQIIILQVLYRLFRHFDFVEWSCLTGFAIAVLLMAGIVQSTDLLRKRSPMFDKAYRGIFA